MIDAGLYGAPLLTDCKCPSIYCSNRAAGPSGLYHTPVFGPGQPAVSRDRIRRISRQTAHLTGGFIQTSQISARTWYMQNARPFRPGAHVTSFLTSLARIFPYAPARVLILYRVVPGGQGHRVAVGSCEPMSFRIRLIIPRLGGYLAMKCLLVLIPATAHTLLI